VPMRANSRVQAARPVSSPPAAWNRARPHTSRGRVHSRRTNPVCCLRNVRRGVPLQLSRGPRYCKALGALAHEMWGAGGFGGRSVRCCRWAYGGRAGGNSRCGGRRCRWVCDQGGSGCSRPVAEPGPLSYLLACPWAFYLQSTSHHVVTCKARIGPVIL
jgi:hypothetical protein